MATEKLMDRIAKMIAQAESVGLDTPEGRVFMERAQEMMSAHKLEEAVIRARNGGQSSFTATERKPMDETIDWISIGDKFQPVHTRVLSAIMQLTDVRVMIKGGYTYRLHLIGYPDDIKYFRMLWLSSYLAFNSKLNPEWNDGMADHRQIRAFVEAGYKWEDIWDKAVESGRPFTRVAKGETVQIPRPPGDNGWMKRQLTKAYAETGGTRPHLTHNREDYRIAFAKAFQNTMTERLYDMLATRRRIERQASSGAALVLSGDANAVDDYYNALYPLGSYSTSSDFGTLPDKHNARAEQAGRMAAAGADLSGGRGGVGRGTAGAIG